MSKFLILSFFLSFNIFASSKTCEHICSDTKCKLIKELNGHQFAELLLENQSVLDNYEIDKPFLRSVIHYRSPSTMQFKGCTFKHQYKTTLKDFVLESWYLEKREYSNFQSVTDSVNCKNEVQNVNDYGQTVNTYIYGTARQIAEGYRNGNNDAKFYLYETNSREKVVWIKEELRDVHTGKFNAILERIYSLEKSLYHGNYLYKFNSFVHQGQDSFCLYTE